MKELTISMWGVVEACRDEAERVKIEHEEMGWELDDSNEAV